MTTILSLPSAPGRRGLLHRVFVEYNPLYFASALCFLAGVYLVARELPKEDFGSKLGIVASTEGYQFLLILAAAVLLRAGLRRPAVILGLACLAFLLDVAMNSERLLSHVGLLSLAPGMRARKAVPVSLALALLGPTKLWLLAVVFRLRSAKAPLFVSGLALLALPLLPYLTELVEPTRRETVYLIVAWLGAPLLAWACSPAAARWTSAWLGDDQEPRFQRIARIAPLLVAGLFIAHGLLWSFIASLSRTPALLAPYFLVGAGYAASRWAARLPRAAEFTAWAGTAAALISAALSEPSTGLRPLAVMLLVAGVVLVYLLEARGLQLFLLAASCLFGGAYLTAAGGLEPLPTPSPLWPAGLAAALLAGAVRHRDFRCLLGSALAVAALVAAFRQGEALIGYGSLAAGLWLAVGGWVVFPSLRRWVPMAATILVLGIGAWMLWREFPGAGFAYGGLAATAAGVGIAVRRPEFLGAGISGGAVLAAFKHGSWIPASSAGWGVLLLAAGFVFLTVGVGVNLLLARHRTRADAPAPVETPP